MLIVRFGEITRAKNYFTILIYDLPRHLDSEKRTITIAAGAMGVVTSGQRWQYLEDAAHEMDLDSVRIHIGRGPFSFMPAERIFYHSGPIGCYG